MRLARLELVQSQLTAGFPSQRPALPLRSEPVFRCASSPAPHHPGEVAASLGFILRAVKRIFEKGGHWAVDAAYVSELEKMAFSLRRRMAVLRIA